MSRGGIGVLDSGLPHHRKGFEQLGADNLPEIVNIDISKFSSINLYNFKALIIPFYSNEVILDRMYKKLKKYLNRGGVGVVLGIDHKRKPWFKEITLDDKRSENIRYDHPKEGKDAILIEREIEDLKFHESFYGHGKMKPPESSENLIIDTDAKTDENSVLYVKRNYCLGRILKRKRRIWCGASLITTIDPDHHRVQQAWIVNDPDAQKRIKENAEKFLINIIRWASSESDSMPLITKLTKYIFRFFGMITSHKILTVLLFIAWFSFVVLGTFDLKALSSINVFNVTIDPRLTQLAGSFASITSLIIALIIVIKQRAGTYLES